MVRVVAGPDHGTMITLPETMTIGRDADLRLKDPAVSRQHLRLIRTEAGASVEDLGSRGGTTVNGGVSSDAKAGNLIEVGQSALRLLGVTSGTPPGAATLEVAEHDRIRSVPLADGLTIGRDPGSDIQIDHPSVSRRHAILSLDGSEWSVIDESSNGSWINGRRVRGRALIRPGDELTLGQSEARIARPSPPPNPAGRVRLRLSQEGDDRSWAVTVSTEPGATCTDVTRELGAYLGRADRPTIAYRITDGLLLPPDESWHAVGMRDGDQLVIADGETPRPTGARPLSRRDPVVRGNQLPRTVRPPAEHAVRPPAFPESLSLRGRGLLWQVLGGAGMLFGGAALAILRPAYAIFGAIMVTAGVISLAASILGDQSRRRHRHRDWEDQLGELDDDLHRVVGRQREDLRNSSPDLDELTAIVTSPGPRLFERRSSDEDALRLRIGIGDLRARIKVDAPSMGFGRTGEAELDEILAAHRLLKSVPVCSPGLGSPLLGIVGPSQPVTGLVNRMLVEAAALHPPDQLRIWILADDSTWGWARWLPHAAAGSALLTIKPRWNRLRTISSGRSAATAPGRTRRARQGHS